MVARYCELILRTANFKHAPLIPQQNKLCQKSTKSQLGHTKDTQTLIFVSWWPGGGFFDLPDFGEPFADKHAGNLEGFGGLGCGRSGILDPVFIGGKPECIVDDPWISAEA